MKKFLLTLAACVLGFVAPARATVPSSNAFLQYTLSTNPQALPVTFVFQSSSDLLILDSKASPPVTLVQSSDYSVSGGSGSTGTVTTIAGGTNGVQVGDVITILRLVPLTQNTNFTNTGPLTAAMIGTALDKLTQITQQLNVRLGNALLIQQDETINTQMSKAAREGMLVGFDTSGNLAFVPTGTTPISGYVTQVLPGSNVTTTYTGSTPGTGVVTVNATVPVPGGNPNEVQFNSSGTFAGTNGMTWNGADLINQQNINGNSTPLMGVFNISSGTLAAASIAATTNDNLYMTMTGQFYSGSLLTNGPSGETGNLYTTGITTLAFGTNRIASAYIDTSQIFRFVRTLQQSNSLGGTDQVALFQNTNTVSSSAVAEMGLANSTNNLLFDMTSTAFAGTRITNGVAGQSANIYTNAAVPLAIGANSIAGITFNGTTGLATLVNGAVATSQIPSDNSSKVATDGYVISVFASPPSFGSTAPNQVFGTTISATQGITPSQSFGIIGTTTNNNANTGSVGEFVTATVATGSALSTANNTPKTVTSISLTAGDWDVWGVVDWNLSGVTSTWWEASISGSTNTIGSQDQFTSWNLGNAANNVQSIPTPVCRLSLSTTTTEFLVQNSAYSGGTVTVYGSIFARRVR